MKQGACCAHLSLTTYCSLESEGFLFPLFFCEVPTCFVFNGYLF